MVHKVKLSVIAHLVALVFWVSSTHPKQTWVQNDQQYNKFLNLAVKEWI